MIKIPYREYTGEFKELAVKRIKEGLTPSRSRPTSSVAPTVAPTSSIPIVVSIHGLRDSFDNFILLEKYFVTSGARLPRLSVLVGIVFVVASTCSTLIPFATVPRQNWLAITNTMSCATLVEFNKYLEIV